MMSSLYLLLPLSVLFAVGIGAAFWWAVFSGQFDNMQDAAQSVLADDDSSHSAEADVVKTSSKADSNNIVKRSR